MPRFHGCWSLGSVAGAGLGVLATRMRLPVTAHLSVMALACGVLVIAGAVTFMDDRAGPDRSKHSGSLRTIVRRLGAIGLLTLFGAIIEGAAGDWLAIYLIDAGRASHATAAAAYAVFVGAAASGRFIVAHLYHLIDPVATVRLGAVVAGVGVGVSVDVPIAPASFAGAFCWGLGICVVFPAALSAGARVSSTSDEVTTLTTIGYSASLIGPPLIGTLARAIGLGPALLLLPTLAGMVLVLAPSVNHVATGSAP